MKIKFCASLGFYSIYKHFRLYHFLAKGCECKYSKLEVLNGKRDPNDGACQYQPENDPDYIPKQVHII